MWALRADRRPKRRGIPLAHNSDVRRLSNNTLQVSPKVIAIQFKKKIINYSMKRTYQFRCWSRPIMSCVDQSNGFNSANCSACMYRVMTEGVQGAAADNDRSGHVLTKPPASQSGHVFSLDPYTVTSMGGLKRLTQHWSPHSNPDQFFTAKNKHIL